jgi:DNA-binding transcriptional ArsR family regulator
MAEPEKLWLTEVETLRAMAHPMRMQILGSLRVDGPATSAILARRLATDSGQTSHHLRLLARYGFIEEAPELGKGTHRRERWWKAAHGSTYWSSDQDELGPGGAEAVGALDRAARRVWDRAVEAYRAQAARGEWSRAWQEVAGGGDTVIRTTPERLDQLRTELWRLIKEYDLGDDPVDDAEKVLVIVQAYPHRAER